MTLTVSLVSRMLSVQVSDRRMSAPGGRLVNDRANKAIVVACADALFSITFAGWGVIGRKRVDLALAEHLNDLGATELHMEDVVSLIAQKAAEMFAVLRPDERHHGFTIAGYQTANSKSEPRLLTLTNLTNGGFAAPALDRFERRDYHRRDEALLMLATGSGAAAITRGDRTRLEARLRTVFARGALTHTSISDIERGIVTLVRSAADRARGTVGKDCMSIAITPFGDARALYYGQRQANPRSYGPLCLWSAGGRNMLVGDIELLSGAGYSIVVGGNPSAFRLLVGSSDAQRSAPPVESFTSMLFRTTNSTLGTPIEEVTVIGSAEGIVIRDGERT
jgi:hypothetical protein